MYRSLGLFVCVSLQFLDKQKQILIVRVCVKQNYEQHQPKKTKQKTKQKTIIKKKTFNNYKTTSHQYINQIHKYNKNHQTT